mmetsp:Transcript_28788/g.95621  ORF Transcript_28788/g.95621 Transcript_28788/m.95621 type:complete len:249 (+) Transcript_28788:286-1032(+)
MGRCRPPRGTRRSRGSRRAPRPCLGRPGTAPGTGRPSCARARPGWRSRAPWAPECAASRARRASPAPGGRTATARSPTAAAAASPRCLAARSAAAASRRGLAAAWPAWRWPPGSLPAAAREPLGRTRLWAVRRSRACTRRCRRSRTSRCPCLGPPGTGRSSGRSAPAAPMRSPPSRRGKGGGRAAGRAAAPPRAPSDKRANPRTRTAPAAPPAAPLPLVAAKYRERRPGRGESRMCQTQLRPPQRRRR